MGGESTGVVVPPDEDDERVVLQMEFHSRGKTTEFLVKALTYEVILGEMSWDLIARIPDFRQ